MKTRGKLPEKELLSRKIKVLCQSVKTKEELELLLKESGLHPYYRKGVLTGIWNTKHTRKYRLRNLGVDVHQLGLELIKEQELKRRLNRDKNKQRKR